MNNALICFPNRADAGAFSGGSWSSTLPLANAQDKDIKKVARSTNATTGSTKFVFTLTNPQAIRLVSLVNTNASRETLYRIKWANDSAFAYPLFDSGWTQMYPVGTVPYGSFEWEEEGFWDGRPNTEQIAYYPRDLICVFPQNHWGQYLSVEIDDTTNTNGYFQFGRLFMGKGFTPRININWGRSLQHNSSTTVQETLSRREIFDMKPLVRTEVFDLNSLSESEGSTLFDMERQLDVAGELFYVLDSSDLVNLARTSFLGRLEKLSPLTNPSFDIYSKQFQIKEIV